MENQRFDDLTRKLANGVSRRRVLGGLAGGALAAVGLRGGATAKPNKVDLCHLTGNGSYRHINVSVNALDAHLRHGDRIPDTCDENSELDYATCECACPPTDCGPGYILDGRSCLCRCQDYERGTIAEFGVRCTENGVCLDTAEGIRECVDNSPGACTTDEGCESSDDCTDGWRCVMVSGFGDNHCCPPG